MACKHTQNLINKKEASRKKSLGELGELFAIKALVDNHFEKIVNLNDKKRIFLSLTYMQKRKEIGSFSALKPETNTKKIIN